MSQLLTLIWLKWRLLRNSLRSSKAVVNRVASILGMLIALFLALMVALVLGFAAYALSQPDTLGDTFRRTATRDLPESASAEFIFFSMFGLIYLMWATVPLSIGGSKQFDAGKLLMYPITLRKLFAVDFLSELTTLHSIFAIPAVIAICLGAGFGTGNTTAALLTAIPAILFGIVEMAFNYYRFTSSSQTSTRRNDRCANRRCCRFERGGSRTDRAGTFQTRRIVSFTALDAARSRCVSLSRQCRRHRRIFARLRRA
jgi:hypothetical protein